MERIQHLEINFDFLPALELFYDDQESKHKCFLVQKGCPHQLCDGWRISHCLAEMDHFCANLSCEHKKCYKVLKYLFQFDEGLYFVPKQIAQKQRCLITILPALIHHSLVQIVFLIVYEN